MHASYTLSPADGSGDGTARAVAAATRTVEQPCRVYHRIDAL
jgi:hypothetical protein